MKFKNTFVLGACSPNQLPQGCFCLRGTRAKLWPHHTPKKRNKLPSGLCVIVLVWSNLEGDHLYLQCWTSQAQKHRGKEKEHGGVGASGQSAVAKAEERTVGKRSSVCSGTGLHVQWILPLKHLFIYTLLHFRVNNEH